MSFKHSDILEEFEKRKALIDKHIDRLSGNPITLSYFISSEQHNFLDYRENNTRTSQGERVDCVVELDDTGNISRIVSAKKVKFNYRYEDITWEEYKETEETSEEDIDVSEIDMEKLDESLKQKDKVIEKLENEKRIMDLYTSVPETTTHLGNDYYISDNNTIYDIARPYRSILGAKEILLPTGERLSKGPYRVYELGEIPASMRDDILLYFDVTGKVPEMISSRTSYRDIYFPFNYYPPELVKKIICGATIPLESFIDMYVNRSPEQIKELAEQYDKRMAKLRELSHDMDRIYYDREEYKDPIDLTEQEGKVAELEEELKKYNGFVGFFRKIFRRSDYDDLCSSLETENNRLAADRRENAAREESNRIQKENEETRIAHSAEMDTLIEEYIATEPTGSDQDKENFVPRQEFIAKRVYQYIETMRQIKRGELTKTDSKVVDEEQRRDD